ncbi:hypothetical protein [Amycolatopsis sp. cmx-4-83]|uniref:hypothetical protein n=1 Tax=Amycolatopsis sp. cmx-4-83 TaxID=2790940 RepID=UPI0039780180
MPVREVGVEVGWGPAGLKGTRAPEPAEREALHETCRSEAPAPIDATDEILASRGVSTPR